MIWIEMGAFVVVLMLGMSASFFVASFTVSLRWVDHLAFVWFLNRFESSVGCRAKR